MSQKSGKSSHFSTAIACENSDKISIHSFSYLPKKETNILDTVKCLQRLYYVTAFLAVRNTDQSALYMFLLHN